MAVLLNVLASGVIDNSGNPLDSGVVYIYEVGTTTPIDAYQDVDLTTPHTNPVILDSAGRAEVYVGRDVRIVIEDADGNQIQDIDAIGSTTGLTGEVITIGSSASDILELNASIEGDLIPVTDNTYDVGSDTNRWAEGHFVNMEVDGDLNVEEDLEVTGDIAQNDFRISSSVIDQGMANNPDWINNLGFTLASGTLTITDAGGAALSTSNIGALTMQSTTGGLLKTLKVTAPAVIYDDNATTSSFANYGFGVVLTVDWLQDIPFFIYAINRANSDFTAADGTSKFAISRNPCLHTTPSSANDIGDTGAIPATDSQNSMIIMGDVTVANYINLPCRLIGAFRMQYGTTNDDWVIQTLGNSDGIGNLALKSTFGRTWTYPTGQNGGATSTRFTFSASGTTPAFTTNNCFYTINPNGVIEGSMYQTGAGTNGSGAVTMFTTLPAAPSSSYSTDPNIIGFGRVISSSYDTAFTAQETTQSGFAVVQFQYATLSGANLTNNTAFVQNADFTGSRTIYFNFRYKAY